MEFCEIFSCQNEDVSDFKWKCGVEDTFSQTDGFVINTKIYEKYMVKK